MQLPQLLSSPHPIAWIGFPTLAAVLTQLTTRLVAQVATAVEPVERHAGFVRVATGVGCLAWTLDAAGLVIFGKVDASRAQLWPALLALCILLVSARFSIPALASTRQRRNVVLASIGLTSGYLASHIALLGVFGISADALSWPPLVASWIVGVLTVLGLSLRARARRLANQNPRLPQLLPFDIGMAGVAMLIQQVLLSEVVTSVRHGSDSPVLPLTALGLFAILVCAEQLFGQRIETVRQRLFDRALDRPHTLRAEAGSSDHRRLAMIAERADALLKAPQLRLNFQPITPFVRARSGGVRFEALLRLHDAELGRIDPEQFLLVCERTFRTARADRAILSEALRCSTQWLYLPEGCSGISVNISHETLLDADFLPWLRDQLVAGAWPYGWLQLEITEHAMILHAEGLAGVLHQLREMGVGAVIDDFGAGFSSLGSLVDLPIQGIKCDRVLVRDLSVDSARQTLLQHLCALASELGLSVTVEGVETQADLDIVRTKGATTVQGYVFARPMPHEDVPHWLSQLGQMAGTVAA